MTYRLRRFGTTELPLAVAEFDAGTADSVNSIVKTVDGFFDTLGAAQAERVLPYQLLLRAELVEATVAALRTTAAGLRALRGERLALWREWSSGGELQWAWARLKRIGADRGPEHRMWQPMTLAFEVLSSWYGAHYDGDGWVLDALEVLDAGLYLDTGTLTILDVSPKDITITHSGDAAITNPVITITNSGGTAITTVTVKNTVGTDVWEWTFDGTIAVGTALVVDCGAQTVKNAGVNAYADWDLTTNHNQSHWFAFQPGANTITVTLNGGGITSTIAFDYSEAWE